MTELKWIDIDESSDIPHSGIFKRVAFAKIGFNLKICIYVYEDDSYAFVCESVITGRAQYSSPDIESLDLAKQSAQEWYVEQITCDTENQPAMYNEIVLSKLTEKLQSAVGEATTIETIPLVLNMCSAFTFPMLFQLFDPKEVAAACRELIASGKLKLYEYEMAPSFVPIEFAHIEELGRDFELSDIKLTN